MVASLKPLFHIFQILLVFSQALVLGQTQTYRENNKWGIKEHEKIIIPAAYDTIFNFDSTNKICLACFKIKTASPNKFIKILATSYACNYLNKKNEQLVIRNIKNDTCSVFSLGKSTLKQYLNKDFYFIAGTKSKKFLLDKDFRQITFRGYHEISRCAEPKFYITQIINEADVVVTGLVNEREEQVIPYLYTNIKINTDDSLIIACSAGIWPKTDDDVFNYEGKKVGGSHRHIDLATKNFMVHQVFEPKEYFIIYNLLSKEEKILNADEVKFYKHDEILIRIKHDWFIYDMYTNQKRPLKQT